MADKPNVSGNTAASTSTNQSPGHITGIMEQIEAGPPKLYAYRKYKNKRGQQIYFLKRDGEPGWTSAVLPGDAVLREGPPAKKAGSSCPSTCPPLCCCCVLLMFIPILVTIVCFTNFLRAPESV